MDKDKNRKEDEKRTGHQKVFDLDRNDKEGFKGFQKFNSHLYYDYSSIDQILMYTNGWNNKLSNSKNVACITQMQSFQLKMTIYWNELL